MTDWWQFDKWGIHMGIDLSALGFGDGFVIGVLMMFPIIFLWRSRYRSTIDRLWERNAHLDLALKIFKDNLDQVPGTHVQNTSSYNRMRELIDKARSGKNDE